jgi:hypothetical protein
MRDKPLLRSKTWWAGVLGLIGAVSGWATGELPLNQALQTGLTAAIGIFLRDAVRSRT